MAPCQPPNDRRVRKTQALLHEAIGTLIGEKAYDTISIREILDRANVGRSTFYTHFRDKDDLLVSSMHDMLRAVRSSGPPPSASREVRLIWFSRPIFEHVHQHRRASDARMGARGRAVVHEHLRSVLVDLITDEMRRQSRDRRGSAPELPPALLVQHVASTFVLVLDWWVQTRSGLAPGDVDDLFRALVLPTLTANGAASC
jgi:AcrR family transcriptional regulator